MTGNKAFLICVLSALLFFPGEAKSLPRAPDITTLLMNAAQGNADAEYRLGSLYCVGMKYSNGAQIEKDGGKCVDFLTRAASQGHPDAQVALGKMYHSGTFVPQDYRQSYYWLCLAAMKTSRAVAARDAVEAKLTPEVILSVQEQIQAVLGTGAPPPMQ